MQRVREILPDVRLVLREMVTSAQIDGLAGGDLDLGIVRPPISRPGIATRPLHHERLVAAVPADHDLADVEHLAIEDFDGQPVIMYSPTEARYFNELLISTFTAVGASPRYVQFVTQVHTMLVLVHSGLGLALVPESATTMHPDGVVFKEVTAIRDRPVQMNVAWRADNTNPALHRLMNDVLPEREWI